MRVVLCFGMAYRVSERKYKKLLEDIRDTGGVDVEKYGTRLGKSINVTDMTQAQAARELEDLKEQND